MEEKNEVCITRRSFLKSTGGALALTWMSAGSFLSLAKRVHGTESTATESYSFKLGTFDCIAINDGTFAYPNPASLFFANAPEERLAEVLREHNLDPEQWEEHFPPYLSLVISTGQHRVLVDTGAGGMAPTTGKLIPTLQGEGITPEEIDIVILTHGHPDHIGGNVDSEGKPAFPNARYVMWKDEWGFLDTRAGSVSNEG